MSIQVGMIGLTHPHSVMHLRTLEASDEIQGIVIYDPDPTARQRIAETFPKVVASHGDLDILLGRSDVPLVFVALPNDITPDAVIRAASAGKHVICEKPCARSASEMRPVLDVLERGRVQFAVCYIWRANPAILKMRELVRDGALGRLTSVELRMVTTQVKMRNPGHWLFKRDVAGGGILSWLGCHWLDLLRYLTDQEVTHVSAMTATLSGEQIDVEDVASVSMRLSGGTLASLHAGYLLSSGRPGYEGAGYDQAIILRGTEGNLSHQRAGDDQIVTLESVAANWKAAPRQVYHFSLPPSPAYGGVHGLEFVDAFIRTTVSGVGASPATALDALRVLEILDAIYRSAATEQVVRLEQRR